MAEKYVAWIVVDGDGGAPFVFDNKREAERAVVLWDAKYPSLSPHRIIQVEESK